MALRAVPEHPKFARLKRTLGLSKFEALGILEALWHFTGKFAPRGNVGKFKNDEIEDWVEWSGEPGMMVDALIATGWLDQHQEYRLVVHDWHVHADQTTKKQLGRTREGFVQDTSGQSSDMSRDGGKQSGPPVPVPEPEPAPVPEPSPKALALTAASAIPAHSPFIAVPLNDGFEFSITEEHVAGWQLLYPAIDVRQQIRNYKGWAINNPINRKTRGGILKSVNSWLAKEQNQARPARGDYRGDHHRKPNPSADREAVNFHAIEAAGRTLRKSDGINEK
jgi:hypothetical protein